MSAHLTMENIELCITGELDESRSTQFLAHLKVCDVCRQEYEECQKNLEAMSEIQKVWQRSCADEIPSDCDEVSPETEEIDGYQLIREIHRGGQGVVYEAFQMATQRQVALKVLLGGPFAGKKAKQRFEREVNLAASLHHPHIVTIHDSGIARDRYYLVMDYIRGESLDHYVCDRVLSFDQKVDLFKKICDAVGFAHQRGVIHRDLKPSNILVTESGEPCVLDFGLARNVDEDDESETISIEGQILGTPKYMAPEQTEGKLSQIDARTDVYALGLIFYKILTGELPYLMDGNIRQILSAIQEAPPMRPSLRVPGMDKDIEVIVLKALEKNADRRYQSVAELGRDLELWQQGLPIVARSASSMYVLNKLISRHRFTTSILGLLLVIVLGSLAICFDLYRTTEAARARSEIARAVLNEKTADHRVASRAFYFLLFLNAWENGLVEDAQNLIVIFKDSREGYGAEFLLDPYPLVEKEAKLREKLGPSRAAFVEFLLGELHRREGRWVEASESYEKSLSLFPSGRKDKWLKEWMAGRIEDVACSLHGKEVVQRP